MRVGEVADPKELEQLVKSTSEIFLQWNDDLVILSDDDKLLPCILKATKRDQMWLRGLGLRISGTAKG